MKYIVLGKDGKEYGPVDPDTLKKWVEHGRVFKDTQVRNALMKKWNEAGTLDLLQESFAVQQQNEEAEEGVSDKLLGILGFGKANNEEPEEREVKTAFKQKYVPNPATPGQRIGAFIFDSVICLAFGVILFILMNISTGTLGLGDFSLGQSTEIANTSESDTIPSSESSKNEDISDTAKDNNNPESITSANSEASDTTNQPNFSDTFTVPEEVKANVPKLNSSFYHYFAIFVAGILLYYGIGLGLFAQTLGMHYWGILIVKGYNDEAFPARTFAFTIGMFAIGIITPIVVLLNPQHRSIHGYLTGTRLIRVAAKPKA